MTNIDTALLERRIANLELLVTQLIKRDAQVAYDRARANGAEHPEAVQATLAATREWTHGLDALLQESVLRTVARMFEN